MKFIESASLLDFLFFKSARDLAYYLNFFLSFRHVECLYKTGKKLAMVEKCLVTMTKNIGQNNHY